MYQLLSQNSNTQNEFVHKIPPQCSFSTNITKKMFTSSTVTFSNKLLNVQKMEEQKWGCYLFLAWQRDKARETATMAAREIWTTATAATRQEHQNENERKWMTRARAQRHERGQTKEGEGTTARGRGTTAREGKRTRERGERESSHRREERERTKVMEEDVLSNKNVSGIGCFQQLIPNVQRKLAVFSVIIKLSPHPHFQFSISNIISF